MFGVVIVLFTGIAAGIVRGQDNTARTTPPDGSQYQLVEVASGLSHPLFLTYAPDGSGRMFIVEQDGRILVMKDGKLLDAPFLDASKLISRDASERGLLGLA